MDQLIKKVSGLVLLVTAYFLVLGVVAGHSAPAVKRIAVLPVYMSDGEQNATFDGLLHGQRMIEFINYWQLNTDFEVVDLFASANINDKRQIKQIMHGVQHNFAQLAKMFCDQYQLDAVVVMTVAINALESSKGYWKARVHAVIDGFDDMGKSLGIDDNEDIAMTQSNFDSAIKEAEKELGYRVARTLSIQLDNPVQIVGVGNVQGDCDLLMFSTDLF